MLNVTRYFSLVYPYGQQSEFLKPSELKKIRKFLIGNLSWPHLLRIFMTFIESVKWKFSVQG